MGLVHDKIDISGGHVKMMMHRSQIDALTFCEKSCIGFG